MLIKNIIMAQKKNVIGEKYNRLLIIGDAPSKREPSGRLIKRVEVKCDCGTEKVVDYKQLKRDKIKSCGCISKEIKRNINTGDTFGCLTILEELGGRTKTKKWERTFRVVCKCGDEKIRTLKELKTNIQKCRMCPSTAVEKIRKEKLIPQDTEEEQWKQVEEFPTYYISSLGRTFNYISQNYREYKKEATLNFKNKVYKRQTLVLMYKTFIGEIPAHHIVYSTEIKIESLKLKETSSNRKIKLRATYNNMKHRCYNETSKDYKSYGAKGIKIEEDFNTFEKFFIWAIQNGYEPDKGLEIDRIDGTKNYTSSNCRWVTKEENILNQYNLTVDDVKWIRSDSFTMEEALERLKCSEYTINNIRNYVSFKNI